MRQFSGSTLASVFLAAIFGIAQPADAQQHSAHEAAAAAVPSKVVQTKEALRDLWVEHVFWIRNVVVETMAGNAAAAAAADHEVVANARQIAASIEPFYGKAASEKLFGLLAGHYGAVKQYLEATVANSAAKQDAAWKSIGANAEEIAVFLSSANPNLPVDTLRAVLSAHGAHHVQQIKELQSKQYTQEAKTWAAMRQHMYAIADTLAGAIAKQFPAKFS